MDVKRLWSSCRDARKSRLGRSGGSAAVEFAIAFPLQLFISFGLMQLALVAVATLMVNYASFVAARAALVGEDPARAALVALSPLGGTVNPAEAGHPNVAPGNPFEAGLRVPGWGVLRGSAQALHKVHVRVNDDPYPYEPGVSPFTVEDSLAYDDAARFSAGAQESRERLLLALAGTAEVRVVVEFDYELAFPVVDFLFALMMRPAPSAAARLERAGERAFGDEGPEAGQGAGHQWAYRTEDGYGGRGRIRMYGGRPHLVIARECSLDRGFVFGDGQP